MKHLSPNKLTSYIQFTEINPDVTEKQIIRHIQLCKKYQFDAAMIAPCWITLAMDILKDSSVKVATFIDFGMGNLDIAGKVALIGHLKKEGVAEVDYAPNMGYFLSGMYDLFFKESREIVAAADGMPVKAMLQLGMIKNLEEKKHAINLLENAGVDWIKNSSGGWPPGATNATADEIRFIKNTLSSRSRVKASGGIKSYETALSLIEAGAELLGTSNALEIIGVSDTESKNFHSDQY